MPRFSIRPSDPSYPEIELDAVDAGAVLHTFSRRHFDEADVFEADEYVFSVRVSNGGFWTIFQRDASVMNHFDALG